MTKTAKQIRKDIGDVGFEYWVRKWRDDEITVGADFATHLRREVLSDRLSSLGYTVEPVGKPGTSGEYTLAILGLPASSAA